MLTYFMWYATLTYDHKATHKRLQTHTRFRVLGLDTDLSPTKLTVIDTEVCELFILVIKTKAQKN